MKLAEVLLRLDEEIKPKVAVCNFCNKEYEFVSCGYGGESGFAYNCVATTSKTEIRGGYGSTVIDDKPMYWLQEPPTTGLICDDCLKDYIKKGWITDKKVQYCDLCKKKVIDKCYQRKGSWINSGRRGDELYWPYSDQYTLSDKTFTWCVTCLGDKINHLFKPEFDFEKILTRLRTSKGKEYQKYLTIHRQMQLKQKLNRQIEHK